MGPWQQREMTKLYVVCGTQRTATFFPYFRLEWNSDSADLVCARFRFRQLRNTNLFRRRPSCRRRCSLSSGIKLKSYKGCSDWPANLIYLPKAQALSNQFNVTFLSWESKVWIQISTCMQAYSSVKWRCESFLFRCWGNKPLAKTRNIKRTDNYLYWVSLNAHLLWKSRQSLQNVEFTLVENI